MNFLISLAVIIALIALEAQSMATVSKKSPFSRSAFLKKVTSSTKDNFAANIMNSETEKFILENAGSRIYDTYRKRIQRRGKELGIDVPSAWARRVREVPVNEETAEEEASGEGASEGDADQDAPVEE